MQKLVNLNLVHIYDVSLGAHLHAIWINVTVGQTYKHVEVSRQQNCIRLRSNTIILSLA